MNKMIKSKYFILGTLIILSVASIFLFKNILLSKQNMEIEEYNIKPYTDIDKFLLPKDSINNCIYPNKTTYNNWDWYKDDKVCFFVQYPKNWHMLDAVNNVYPTVAFDTEIITEELAWRSKVVIEIVDLEFFISHLSSQSYLYDAEIIYNFEEDFYSIRIRGFLEENKKDEIMQWNYTDTTFIVKDDIYIIFLYQEKEYNQNDRIIFDKMYKSFNLNSIQINNI